MVDIPTHGDLMKLGRSAALLRTEKITDLAFSPGYMLDVHLGLAAAIGEEAVRIALQLHRSTFLETAEGDDLDSLVLDHWGLERHREVRAVGTVRFSRDNTNAGNILLDAGHILETTDGIRFRTTQDVLMLGTEVDVPIEAVEPGESGVVNADTITVIRDLFADASLTVTNPEPTAGGLAAESDRAFRQRVRDYVANLRRGTLTALELGARMVSGVAMANADDSSAIPTVYVSDITGSSNSVMEAAVLAELENWRAAGVHVNVQGAVVVEQTINVSLAFRAGVDTVQLRSQAVDAILDQVGLLQIGEPLYRSALIAAARVDGVIDVVVQDPAGDVVPATNEVIRTRRDLISVT